MIKNRWNQNILLKTVEDRSLVQTGGRGGWERGDPVVKQYLYQSKQNTAIAQYWGVCQCVRVLSQGTACLLTGFRNRDVDIALIAADHLALLLVACAIGAEQQEHADFRRLP